jgi:WD40 repeat protein
MRMITAAHKLNPFPGLRPFTQEEDYLFFGREEQTLELLSRLRSHRFVAVVGASGSGKSSLVRCGLLSELQGGKMRGAGASWEIAVTHPGGNPLGLLTEALLDAGLYDRAQENSRENLLATLSRSHFGLVEAVKQAGLGQDTNFLLVVDQFEEIFRFHEAGQTQQEMANEFVSMLLEAAAQKEVPVYVVLTMRSDFIGECGQFEGLAETVNRGEFLIPRLTREQYKRVIEGPIKVAGGRIAPRLLQRLLNDLGQQADQLPCLQHALMRTWNVWAEKGAAGALDLDDYQRVGKMTHALSLHADEIYHGLPSDRQRQLCRGLFQALTVQESENRGIRRPQRLGRLCQILDVPSDELLPIIDAYRQKGVTFLMPAQAVELTNRAIIDISHESLMRVWTRLRHWALEEAQAAGIYLRLSESAALYEQRKAGLYRDPELGIALAWQESQRPNGAWAERYRPGFEAAMAFLEASRLAGVAEEQAREAARQRELEQARQLAEAQRLRLEQQKRAAKRLRKLIAGLAVVALIAGLACVAALVANQKANTLADIARQNEDQAKQNARQAEQSRKDTEKALAVVESEKAKALAAEGLARAEEEKGRQLLYTTDMRLAPFVWKDGRATAEQLRVLLAKHIPEERMKDEGRRMNKKTSAADSSFILHPSSFQKPDLRGFEWHYYQHLLESSAAVFPGRDVAFADAAFTSSGQLVTLDQNGRGRRWDLDSQDEDKARRRDLAGGPGAQFRILSPDGRLAALAEEDKVDVFDTSTGRVKFQIDSASSPTRRLAFSRDGSRLVIVDNKIRWVSTVSGRTITAVYHKFNNFNSLALSTDGLTLAVVGHGDGTGRQFSIFRLDAAAKKVIPLAKDVAPGGTLQSSALSPDGRRIAVGSKLDPTVFVLDTTTGRPIAQHGSAHASPVTAMAFSGDGAKLATADTEGTIKIWVDAQKLSSKSAALVTLKGHQGAITTISFSSDGKRFVTTSVDKTARVWDPENAGAAIRPLERSGTSWVARFSPDGLLIAASGPGGVRLWDAASGRTVRELPAPDQGGIYSLAFSPADHRLLAVGYGGRADVSYVALWDIDAGTELARLPGASDLPDFRVNDSNGAVGALAFSPDGRYLVAGFGSKNMLMRPGPLAPLKVWDVATRRLIHRLYGHTGYCVSLDFSRDGRLLASGSRDGIAILWPTATWKATQTLQNPDKSSLYPGRGMVEDVAFSPNGKNLAMASREATVHLWDSATGKLLKTLKGHSSAVTAVAFSPDGHTLASGGVDQTVRLWNVETRRELLQLDPGSIELGPVTTLAFSPDGKQLLAGGSSAAFWSAAPLVWNDPNRAADKLRLPLQSNADFRSRIRMLSENLRIHAALAKLDAKDVRVRAALAATQANWHASRRAWPEAARAFDRLLAADSAAPEDWLRTPGLLRLATALVHQNRPAAAARLLQGGAKRRAQDGLPAVELTWASFVRDVATGELLYPLRTAIHERLGKEPGNPGLLELRAELAAQWSDAKAQVADYTAAIDALAHPKTDAAAADLKRLYRRRGSGYVALKHWQKAASDYAHGLTDATADDDLLSNQALAQANCILEQESAATWAVLRPTEMKSQGGATLTMLDDNSILAGGVNPDTDVYVIEAEVQGSIRAVRLEAIPDPRMPAGGSGRAPTWGNFVLTDFRVLVGERVVTWSGAHADFSQEMQFGQKKNFSIALAIDEDESTGWAIWPRVAEPHWAVFIPGQPITVAGKTRLTMRLAFRNKENQKYNLGRFRLSISSNPAAVERQETCFAAMTIPDPWQKLAAAYQLKGDQRAIDQLVERRPKLTGPIGDLFTQGKDAAKDWRRAISLYGKGITPQTTDAVLLSKRARAHEALKNWEAAAADWSRAAAGNPDGAQLLVEFARRLAAGRQVALAQATRARALALFGEKPVKEAELPDLLAKIDGALAGSKRWAEIEPLIRECLAIDEKLAPDHPDALAAMNRLGVACWQMRRFDKSVPLFEKLVRIQEARLGRDHPDTLGTVANLGVNYKDAGRLKEAIPLLEEAVRGAKQAPGLMWVTNPLFDALLGVDDATAAKHFAAVIPTLRTAFGENHYMTLVAMNNRGYNLTRSRQFAEAEPALKDTIEREVRILGEGNMLLLQTRTNLGELYQLQGRHTEAEELLCRCLKEREKREPNSFRLASTQSMLGRVLAEEKKFAEAESLLLAGYKGLKKNAGSTPNWGKYYLPDTLEWLTQLYEAWGKAEEAKKCRAERATFAQRDQRSATKK